MGSRSPAEGSRSPAEGSRSPAESSAISDSWGVSMFVLVRTSLRDPAPLPAVTSVGPTTWGKVRPGWGLGDEKKLLDQA